MTHETLMMLAYAYASAAVQLSENQQVRCCACRRGTKQHRPAL